VAPARRNHAANGSTGGADEESGSKPARDVCR
jgi:hypothetical protein